ncbi:MAG TPA: SDR family NAD(P)-dependent oxidoreductase [Thermoleophilaceae bacterium]|nr:SDR family NAD(P)-dependent oxidoreductase [Thermoleophilaceae bacterium]
MGLQLGGSTVLLTGATGGIGQAIARALHARGARVLLSGRRRDLLESLQEEFGERAEVLVADLADASDAWELGQRVRKVDVLVANAALPASGRLDDFSPGEIDRALDVNLRVPIQLTRTLLPGMIERRRGHLVYVSSLSGKVASAGSSLYSAGKFGLRGFAAGLREDLLEDGVGVTTVFPGFISGAGMFAETGVALPRGVGTRTPDDVAAALVRAIEEGKDEVDVAPLGLRAAATLGALAPNAMARVQRRLGSSEISAQMADAQRIKR